MSTAEREQARVAVLRPERALLQALLLPHLLRERAPGDRARAAAPAAVVVAGLTDRAFASPINLQKNIRIGKAPELGGSFCDRLLMRLSRRTNAQRGWFALRISGKAFPRSPQRRWHRP
jgi:hypothetical protein